MDRLWAPWRNKYIRGKKQKKCVFCSALKKKRKNYVVLENTYSFAILNTFPYNNGHIMVSPKRHVADISLLKDDEILDLFKSLKGCKRLLDKALKPHGYNIGINISQTAGAGITGHLHLHIVPRWKGDNNFMPVLYNTRVVSQSLDELFRRLKSAKV